MAVAVPEMREGTRKGVPNIVCPSQTSQYAMTGSVPIQQSKKQ